MKRIILILVLSIICLMSFGFAQEPDKIIFSHKFHNDEVGVECDNCHGSAMISLLPSDNLLPEMSTCYNCHDEDDTECGYCHTNTDEPGIAERPPQYKSKFSHKTHLESGADCLTCHQGITKKTQVGKFHIPNAGNCASCHSPVDYSEEQQKCLVCHDASMDFSPADHEVNWKKDHGPYAQFAEQTCSHCHQQNYCQNCHQGDNLDREVHPLNFRNNHGIIAKGDKENCLTCHQEQLFCIDCHRTEMVMPQNHSYVNWSNRIKGNGGRHAKEAKFDFDNCMSCHNDAYTDIVCVTCHGN
jgi:hypothetical protein